MSRRRSAVLAPPIPVGTSCLHLTVIIKGTRDFALRFEHQKPQALARMPGFKSSQLKCCETILVLNTNCGELDLPM